jgi:hypothetical protein
MSRTVLRTILLTTAVVAGLLAAPAANASTTRCTDWQPKEFATPGYNTNVEIRLCVEGYTSAHSGYAETRWWDGGDYYKKFDNFDVRIRVERYDADYDSTACSYESSINLFDSNYRICDDGLWVGSGPSGGWSVDGYVAYNLDGDGEGGKTWSLHGTPLVD